jgi:glutamate-1-semialdehyde aminotransferase
MPYGVNSPVRFYEPYPFFAVSANGSKIVTADHEIFIDYCMGYGAILLGHAHPTVTETVKNQLDIGNLYGVPTETFKAGRTYRLSCSLCRDDKACKYRRRGNYECY